MKESIWGFMDGRDLLLWAATLPLIWFVATTIKYCKLLTQDMKEKARKPYQNAIDILAHFHTAFGHFYFHEEWLETGGAKRVTGLSLRLARPHLPKLRNSLKKMLTAEADELSSVWTEVEQLMYRMAGLGWDRPDDEMNAAAKLMYLSSGLSWILLRASEEIEPEVKAQYRRIEPLPILLQMCDFSETGVDMLSDLKMMWVDRVKTALR